MDAAQVVPVEQALSWDEICKQFPDQYVCLVDVTRSDRSSPEILTARVVGHGDTQEAAFEPIRGLGERYPRFAVRFTGACSTPLRRPSLVLDAETLELLRS